MKRHRTGLLLTLAAAGGALLWAAARKRRHWKGFRGRVALVTGGSRGLDKARCRERSRRGAKIVLCARAA